MSKIICNSADFVFWNEIKSMIPGEAPILIELAEWKKIDVNEKPTYQSSVKQNDAGPTNEETVNVQAKRNNITELLMQYCGFHTILRMSTDEKIFYVGNIDYPCTMEITNDKIFDNYTFKAISPA